MWENSLHKKFFVFDPICEHGTNKWDAVCLER